MIIKSTYTAQTGLKSLEKFRQDCNDFYRLEIIRRIPKIVKFATAIAIHQVLKRSPVVTGSYISSHQLTKQYLGTKYTIRKAIMDPKTGQPIKQNKSRMRRTARTRLFQKLRTIQVRLGGKTLQLSNAIPYGDQVEYGFVTGARGHQVYTLAYQNTRMALMRILGNIQTLKWNISMDSEKIDAAMTRADKWLIRDLPSLKDMLDEAIKDPEYEDWIKAPTLTDIPSDW